MASAYSVPQQFNQYIAPVDVGFVNTILATKQGQYDANLAKVDALVESYTNIPLVRQEDKQMLYQNIMAMENEINTFSKMELTNSNTLRSIQTSLQSAVTPYIAEQFVNSQKIVNFQTEMAKKREKNPELWNDANYQDALDQAGFNEYMNGVDKNGNKIDKLGELRYNDYYDIHKNMVEPMEKYFKEFGYETVVDESAPNGYIIRTAQGTRLSEEKIQEYINTKISTDPKLSTQLGINARSTYRGLSDEQFMANFTGSIKGQKDLLDKAIVEIDEKLKQTDKNHPDYQVYSSQKAQAEAEKNNFQGILDGTVSPSRSNIEFMMYTNNLKNNYAKSYAYDRVDKISYDDTPLQIAKFESDRAFKQEELRLKTNELNGLNAQGQVAGTPFDIPQGTQEIEKTTSEVVQDEWVNSRNSFSNALSQVEPGFSSLTDEQKTNKLLAVYEGIKNMSIDQSAYPAEVIQEAIKFGTANETNLNYRKDINTRWLPKVDEAYSMILQGRSADLNINNLATTMPNVANLVRQGKSLATMSTQEKNLVRAEISKNIADYVATNREDKNELLTFNFNFRKSLQGETLSAYERGQNRRTVTVTDAPGAVWDLAKATASSAASYLNPSALFADVFQGQEAGNQVREEINQSIQQSRQAGDSAYLRILGAQLSPFQSDRNVGELQARDLGTSEGFGNWFNTKSSEVKLQRTKDLKYVPTNRQVQGMSWNPEDKNQKQYTQSINNLIIAEGKKPAKETTYRAYKQGNEYVFEFLGETVQMGKNDVVKRIVTPQTIRVPANRTPPALVQALGTEESWNTASVNSNVKPITMKYNLPKNETERINRVNNYFSGLGSSLNQTQRDSAYSEGFMATAESIVSPYLNQIRTPEQRQYVEGLMNAEYSTTIVPIQGQGFKAVLNVNGQGTNISSDILPSYNVTDFSAWTDRLVKMYITNNVKNAIRE